MKSSANPRKQQPIDIADKANLANLANLESKRVIKSFKHHINPVEFSDKPALFRKKFNALKMPELPSLANDANAIILKRAYDDLVKSYKYIESNMADIDMLIKKNYTDMIFRSNDLELELLRFLKNSTTTELELNNRFKKIYQFESDMPGCIFQLFGVRSTLIRIETLFKEYHEKYHAFQNSIKNLEGKCSLQTIEIPIMEPKPISENQLSMKVYQLSHQQLRVDDETRILRTLVYEGSGKKIPPAALNILMSFNQALFDRFKCFSFLIHDFTIRCGFYHFSPKPDIAINYPVGKLEVFIPFHLNVDEIIALAKEPINKQQFNEVVIENQPYKKFICKAGDIDIILTIAIFPDYRPDEFLVSNMLWMRFLTNEEKEQEKKKKPGNVLQDDMIIKIGKKYWLKFSFPEKYSEEIKSDYMFNSLLIRRPEKKFFSYLYGIYEHLAVKLDKCIQLNKFNTINLTPIHPELVHYHELSPVLIEYFQQELKSSMTNAYLELGVFIEKGILEGKKELAISFISPFYNALIRNLAKCPLLDDEIKKVADEYASEFIEKHVVTPKEYDPPQLKQMIQDDAIIKLDSLIVGPTLMKLGAFQHNPNTSQPSLVTGLTLLPFAKNSS